MQKKTHIAFGLTLASTLLLLNISLSYVLLAGFVSFIPDIDWLMDKIWFKEESITKKIWKKVFKSRSMHRTFLHNIWAMSFFIFIFGYFAKWDILVLFSTFLGYSSHLIIDSLTVTGIYLFWPYGDERIFKERKFYFHGNIVTGSTKEKILFYTFVLLGGGLFAFWLYSQNVQKFGDFSQALIYVAVLLAIGIFLMENFIKTISKATSRMFRR